MAKDYISLSFHEYPPIEILGTSIYLDSNKELSFQYRSRANDELLAYIAMRKESPINNIPGILNPENGCRILSIWVKPIKFNDFSINNVTLSTALLDEAEMYINGWIDHRNNMFEFDYFWWYNEDFESEMVDVLNDILNQNNISYKILVR